MGLFTPALWYGSSPGRFLSEGSAYRAFTGPVTAYHKMSNVRLIKRTVSVPCQDCIIPTMAPAVSQIDPAASCQSDRSHHQLSVRHHTTSCQSDKYHQLSVRHHTTSCQSDKYHQLSVRHHTTSCQTDKYHKLSVRHHTTSCQSDKYHQLSVIHHTTSCQSERYHQLPVR